MPIGCRSRGNAECLAQGVDLVGGHAEEQGAETSVDGGEQHQHGRHAGVDVPVRRAPARLVAVGPAFVGLGVAVEVRVLVRQAHDQQRRVVQVLPGELVRGLGPNRVPVPRGLLVALEHQKCPALAEACRRRALRVGQDALDIFARQRLRLRKLRTIRRLRTTS